MPLRPTVMMYGCPSLLLLLALAGCVPDTDVGSCMRACQARIHACADAAVACATVCQLLADEEQGACAADCVADATSCLDDATDCLVGCVEQAEEDLEQ